MALVAAWLVHVYTASSAALAVWALVASFSGQPRLAMGLMMLTLAIDSTDGTLARTLEVSRRIPWFDGRRLDDICDYVTYVIVPACFLVATDLLPHPAWAVLPVFASAYGFSRTDAKTDDDFFLGFPSYWNVVSIYLYLGGATPGVAAAVIGLLSLLVFVPMRWIYPSRTRALRPLSVAVLCVWTIGFTWLVVQPEPAPLAVALSSVGPIYYATASFALQLRGRRAKLGP